MVEREGAGWRLAWDPQRHPFPLLIGGEDWASELTSSEGLALRQALDVLQRQHQDLASTLMAEESISLEFELNTAQDGGGSLWVAMDGDRQGWGLRFVLAGAPGARSLEGVWRPGAAAAFTDALQGLDWPPREHVRDRSDP